MFLWVHLTNDMDSRLSLPPPIALIFRCTHLLSEINLACFTFIRGILYGAFYIYHSVLLPLYAQEIWFSK